MATACRVAANVLLACGLAAPIQAEDRIHPNGNAPANSLQATSFIDALIKIATRFQLPLAVEWVQSGDTLQPIRLDQLESASAILDAVLSTHNGYSWQLENGVLHVFERSLVSDTRNPLNVVVDTFSGDPVTVPYADNFLFEAVREVVRPTGLPGVAGNLKTSANELNFHIQSHNDPVREILNKIIMASKMKVWIATFPEKQSLTPKGFFEATPVFDQKYVRAPSQPFWIFLRWSDRPWKRLETPER